MPSFRLTLAYDGTDFSGSQVQPNQRTVQGELEAVLGALSREPVRAVLAGRTDSGVHAIGQIAKVQLPGWTSTAADLQRALNANLPVDLAASRVANCPDSFHPRFDAVWREYRYCIAPELVSPFLGRYAWLPRGHIDAAAIRAAARLLVGTHDLASFAGGGEGVPWSARATRPRGTTRTVFLCDCEEITFHFSGWHYRAVEILEIRVVADAFLPRMVRNIVGALVDIGRGRHDPGWIDELLAKRDRRTGSEVAPPNGLTLWRVGFQGDVINGDRI